MKQKAVEIYTVTRAIICTKRYWGYQINNNGVGEHVEGFRGKKNTEFSAEILKRRDLAVDVKWRIILK